MIHGPWLAQALATRLSGTTVKAMAVTSAHVESPDTQFRSELTDEITGTGYTAGGVAVSGVTSTYDATANRVKITCDVVDFGAVTAPDVAGVVFYIDTGNAATDVVLSTDLFPAVEAEGALSYQPSADGVMYIAV